jgi:hypothetical protein
MAAMTTTVMPTGSNPTMSAGAAALPAAPSPDLTIARVVTCSLPKSAWTHEAHIAAAIALVRRAGAARAMRLLERLIPRLNRAHGTPNTDTSGYHASLTAYYVHAVATLVAAGLPDAAIFTHPVTSREAPLRHWRRETLFSVAARRGLVEPDLCPLPEPFVAAA